MDYEQFKEEILDSIRDYLPEGYKESIISINPVLKNNETLDGLTITSPDSNISPTIYLNSYYEQYVEGRSIDNILTNIAEIRVSHEMDKDFDLSRITDFNQAKNLIVPRILGSEENEELLSTRPHTMMDDLAVTYCIALGEDASGSMSVPITNQLMENWDVSPEELHDIAIENLPNLMQPSFKSMNEVMAEMMLPNMIKECDGDREAAEAMLESMMPPEDKMYVLSNEQKLNGATVLLDDKTMEMITEKLGPDFYILPSSIHETLVIPADAGMELGDLERMVQEVNATQVAPQDRLSDHVYRYDNDTHEVFRADRLEEHLKAKEASKVPRDAVADKAKEPRISLKERLADKRSVVAATPKKDMALAKSKEQSL